MEGQMSRVFPYFLSRPANLLAEPFVATELPTKRPRFVAGDPRPWVRGTLKILENQGSPALPWSEDADFILAPWPNPGKECQDLCRLLAGVDSSTPVALYERDFPVLPNTVIQRRGEQTSSGPEVSDSLSRFRASLRHGGKGEAEALVLLPAQRMKLILKGSFLATFQPRSKDSLQSRRYLHHLLDHQRSLSVLARVDQELSDSQHHRDNPEERVLALAPHFDDEVLLLGAELAQAVESECPMRLLWLTDGGKEGEKRRTEGARAAKILGVSETACLNAPESNIRAHGKWTQDLRQHLEEFKPTRILMPWWLDNHVDHFELTRVLRAAWPTGFPSCTLSLTGFWTPLPFGANVPVHAKLEEALRQHESQLTSLDYVASFAGLNAWYGGSSERPSSRTWDVPAKDYFAAFKESGSGLRRYWNP